MRLHVLVLAILFLAPGALAARTVWRTWEAPAVPCSLGWCTVDTVFVPVGDGYLDVGSVTEPPAPGETLVAATARDAAGAPVLAVLCQDANGDGGCTPNGADLWVAMCDGDAAPTPIAPRDVHVLIPPPGARIASCPDPQAVTALRGSVTFTFD